MNSRSPMLPRSWLGFILSIRYNLDMEWFDASWFYKCDLWCYNRKYIIYLKEFSQVISSSRPFKKNAEAREECSIIASSDCLI